MPERCQDPVFGQLTRQGPTEAWETELDLPGEPEGVTVWVPSPPGEVPSDAQRTLWGRIADRYAGLRDEIHSALHELSRLPADTRFELDTLEIKAEGKSWTAQYSPEPECGDMGYFVDVVDWRIRNLDGAD